MTARGLYGGSDSGSCVYKLKHQRSHHWQLRVTMRMVTSRRTVNTTPSSTVLVISPWSCAPETPNPTPELLLKPSLQDP